MSSTSPLSRHTFFIDRNIGRYQVPNALRALGLTVETHADHFPAQENSPEMWDGAWIRDVTARGWIILTRDKSIRRNPLERAVFISSGARVFNLRNGGANAATVAETIATAARAMQRVIDAEKAPFIVGVSTGGKLTFIDPPR